MMRVKNHHMPATILVEIALVVMFLNKVRNCEQMTRRKMILGTYYCMMH